MSSAQQLCDQLAKVMKEAGFKNMPVVVPAIRKDAATQSESDYRDWIFEEFFDKIPEWLEAGEDWFK